MPEGPGAGLVRKDSSVPIPIFCKARCNPTSARMRTSTISTDEGPKPCSIDDLDESMCSMTRNNEILAELEV